MSMRLIALWSKFTYCVPAGTDLFTRNSADSVVSALAPESRHINTESRRGMPQRRTARQRMQDLLTLKVFQPGSARGRGGADWGSAMTDRVRQVIKSDRLGPSQIGGALEGIVKLADVSRPSITDQSFGRL